MAEKSLLHLSLLSRGVGQVKRNGHEKVDVVLEAQVCIFIFFKNILYIKYTSRYTRHDDTRHVTFHHTRHDKSW